jgi:Ser/Thr protein kinase RdoA (MazF antagonist)
MQDTRHIPTEIKVTDAELNDLVFEHYGIEPDTITPLGGYSNLNYCITDLTNSQYVLRIARGNRSPGSAEAEQHVLRSLEKAGFGLAPRLLSPVDSPSPLQVLFQGAERYVQLSHMIPGRIDCFWWQQCSIDKIEQIFKGLAGLHQAMAEIPALHGLPAAPAFQYELPEQAPALLEATTTGQYVLRTWQAFRQSAIRLQMDMADRYPWHQARYQWIHGDIQLENLLFDGGYLRAFLDFERVSWDACEKDVIFSAFRVCKEGNTDAPFHYDEARFAKAIETYLTVNVNLATNPNSTTTAGSEVNVSNIYLTASSRSFASFFSGYEEFWKPFFCLDQAMVYLENAFDGSWQLAEGIGFLPCYNEVLNYRHPELYMPE